jgi:hypothetical protein
MNNRSPYTGMRSLLLLMYILLLSGSSMFAQDLQAPLQESNYSRLTSYEELSAYLKQLDAVSELLTVEVSGKSVEGRNLYAMKFSSSGFGKDPSKIRVLIFAQQHGNEPSGKEGALLLATELLKPGNRYLFDRIDLLLVPQMNPDGAEVNKRRNGNDADLNRNHLILTEPETNALHKLFDQYMFEVTMDVHEYFPYGETWQKYGYRNNTDELLGTCTNTNVSEKIRDLSNRSYIPFIKKYCSDRQVSNFIYTPGGPPEIEYIRHSTFDINDGRQSFGIQNSLSFIQEGLNGKDAFTDNLKHRAESQMTGMRGLLEFTYHNKKEIKKLVANERNKIIHGHPGEIISIQSEHARNGEKLNLPVYSYFSNTDSVITVMDYRPIVKSLYDVKKPSGYLIPKQLKEVTDWVGRQSMNTEAPIITKYDKIEQYEISEIDSIDFEGDKVIDPNLILKEVESGISVPDYVYVPASQLKGNMLVIALEPKSMLGLVTYKDFAHLISVGKYPILRVTKK